MDGWCINQFIIQSIGSQCKKWFGRSHRLLLVSKNETKQEKNNDRTILTLNQQNESKANKKQTH